MDAKSEGFFYTRLDENHRPSKVFYHKIGTQQADDKLIYEETDPGFFLGVGGSALDDYIFIDIHDHETSGCWLLPADDPSAEPKLVMARKTGTEYDIAPGGDVFIFSPMRTEPRTSRSARRQLPRHSLKTGRKSSPKSRAD